MSRSILLIEDNEQNRYLLTFLLERHGYEVLAVPVGVRGIEAAQALLPTLILLDIQLPTMDGYAVARALRQKEALRRIPIVAVTSHAMPGDRERALQAGCTGYIEKPINPETFVAEMELALLQPLEGSRTRVLIVDDKEENLYYLSSLLSAHGCEVDSARHGAEALVKARAAPPAVVISDLLMPVMDGYTLLRHWKADARLNKAPFIVYTATYTTAEDEQLALNLGADAFILKPAEPEDFLVRLRAVQANAVAARPLPTQSPVGGTDGQLREYSETLIRKLEQKTFELEESNSLLQQDIAARKLAEVALRESEERFRQLAENIDDVFWLSDPAREKMFYVSPAYETLWGQSCESLYARPESWLESVHVEDRERVGASLAGQSVGKWEETYRIVLPDGSVRWIRARAYPVRDVNGHVYRVAGVSRDVTSYRQLEEQFRHAQKMEAVGRLAGGIAHDFNNLLSVILSYASLALDDPKLSELLRADIEEVRRAGQRATGLTRQLLAFSRQQVLQPQVLDLSRVVRDMEKMLRRLLGEEIGLSLLTSQPGGKVHADPSQVEQILLNLVVNARDAMPSGGKLVIEVDTVEVDAASAAGLSGLPAGAYVLLLVTDTGVGMDAATCERIFEPFFTTKEVGKGTGLGLSTVFGIVKQSQGHIQVQSEVGLGTVFKIYLPRTDRPVDSVGLTLPPPVTLRGSETVLLVEDDDQVREMSCAILRRNGYEVIDAQNGGEAFLLSEKFASRIHLLLTDVVMPRISGRELAGHLAPKRPEMKVLYVSGYTEDSVVRRGFWTRELLFSRSRSLRKRCCARYEMCSVPSRKSTYIVPR